MGIMTDINVSLRGRGSVALYGRIVGYGHKALHYLRYVCKHNFLVVIAIRLRRSGNLTTRNNEKGAVLLSVLFFALFFAVLISKIFSTLQETKASSPRIAGAQIERYVSEAAMVQIRGQCNKLRSSAEQYNATPPTGATGFGACALTGENYDCEKVFNIGVDLNGVNRVFNATATVTVIDLDAGGGFQWDCGQLTIDANVQR